ncbi:MAG: DUF2878 domain-containing protein [Kiritimatiellae bacterium]|nr:DUF2878 domain-containing protein [Kiritimatiellia bacterium]
MNVRGEIAAKLFHAVIFQILWIALVISAGSHWSITVTIATPLIAALQLKLFRNTFTKSIVFVMLTVCIGMIMDTFLTLVGIIDPARNVIPFPFPPLWLIGLWIAFATFMKTTLTYLCDKPATQWCIGAIGGPLAYWSGARLGAIELHAHIILSLVVLALAWGCVCVVCFSLLKRLDTSVETGKAA